MLDIAIMLVCLFILVVASWTDIKMLEVPDWLNYSGIAAGLGIALIVSLQQWNYWPVASSAIGLAIAFGLACIMFYSGQWGGGDAKLLMALGALIGFEASKFSFGASYLINLVFVGGAWGIIWTGGLAIRNFKQFWKTFRQLSFENPYKRMRLISLTSAIILIIASFILPELQLPLLALALSSYVLCYLTIFVKATEISSMHRWVTPDKLTEGDWLLKPIKAGKITIKPPRLGLEKKDLLLIQKLYAQKKIKKVLVKYGIPFAPAFLLAFITTLAAGNIVLAIIF